MHRTPDEIDDEFLVLRCQNGERDAIEELVARWRPRLLRHAHRLTGDVDGARDAAQDAWLAIVRGLRSLADPARFAAWAYRVVTFKCADWTRQRQRQRQQQGQGGQDDRGPLDGPFDSTTTASEPADDIEVLRQAMRGLSGEHRAALSLHYLDGRSVAEIASALDIPIGTVKSRLHHARAHLKSAIERVRQQ